MKQHIHDTVSLCNNCYSHIPAIVYEENDAIWISKQCDIHGEQTQCVERDTEFYYSLDHRRYEPTFNQILFEASDRCQLACPHCYHLPDNEIEDRSAGGVVEQLDQFDRESHPTLAGAEATLRPDFIPLIKQIRGMGFRSLEVVSNALRFSDERFTRDCADAGLSQVHVGMNHESYQGTKIHTKQLAAVEKLKHSDITIGYVGYTIETLDHVEDILNEIERIHDPVKILHYRIRCGSFIGRSSDQHRSYLSALVAKVKSILGDRVVHAPMDDNPYHVMMKWNGDRVLRLIQWPDVTNIDMEELVTGPWCQFYDGPITNFVHQAITRDAFKNMSLTRKDDAPKRYQYRSLWSTHHEHWKHVWTPRDLRTITNMDYAGVRERLITDK